MKKFTAVCIDNKYHMECVLSECSFNMACDYIDRQIEKIENIKSKNSEEYIIITNSHRFLYDEETGYLLKTN